MSQQRFVRVLRAQRRNVVRRRATSAPRVERFDGLDPQAAAPLPAVFAAEHGPNGSPPPPPDLLPSPISHRSRPS